MSKRSRSRQRQHTHIIQERRDVGREQEILNTPAAAFANNPIIKVMMDRLAQPDCTEVEAVRIGLALQQLIRGEASLLSNMHDPTVAETVNKIIEQRAEADKAAERYEQERFSFIEDVMEKAERVAPISEKKDETIAKGMKQYEQAVVKSRAKIAERQLRLAHRIANDPKELVNVLPRYERRTVAGVVGEYEVPTEIRIMNKVYMLNAGQQMLPKIIADAYRRKLRGEQENRDRRSVMAKDVNAAQLERSMRQLDQKYGTRRESIMVPSEV